MTEPWERQEGGAYFAAWTARGRGLRAAGRWVLPGLAWLTVAACGRPPRIVEAKGGYFAFGNVEVFQRGPDVLAVESGITEVHYAVLVPLAAALIAALASGYAWWRNRRAHRRADWALPLGSAVLVALLAVVGKNATAIETEINQHTGTIRVEQRSFWGTVPLQTEVRLDDVVGMQVVYRQGRGAYCASMIRRRTGEPSEVAAFQFVDMLTDKVDLTTCERLQARIAKAIGDVPRAGPRAIQ